MESCNFGFKENETLEYSCNTSQYHQKCSNDVVSQHAILLRRRRTTTATTTFGTYSMWTNIFVVILLMIIEVDKPERGSSVDAALSPTSSAKKYSTGAPHALYDVRHDDDNTDLDLDLDFGDGTNDRSRHSGNRLGRKDEESDVFKIAESIEVKNSILVSLEDPVSNEIEPYYDDSQDVIVIATVDGTFYGISKSTGETKWKKHGINLKKNNSSSDEAKHTDGNNDHRMQVNSLKSEEHDSIVESRSVDIIFAPLTSTSTTDPPDTGGRTSKYRTGTTVAIPSVDGRVFLGTGKNNGNIDELLQENGNQPLNDVLSSSSVIVRDLVRRSPFVDSEGRIFIGQSRSSATAFDRDTGEVLSFVRIDNADESSFGNGEEDQLGEKQNNIIWVGRVDYTVSIFSSSGDADVEFSTSEVMSLTNLVNQQAIYNPALMRPSPVIVATPGGKLAMCDSDSEKPLWIAEQTFDTPVVYALESKYGKSLKVDFIADAPVHFSKEYLSSEWKSSVSDHAGTGFDNNVLHDSESISLSWAHAEKELFAVPIGRMRKYSRLPELRELPSSHDDIDTSSKAIVAIDRPSILYTALLASLNNPNPRVDNKNWFHIFSTSWTPPTIVPAIVLFFVLSFEIGRRSRAMKEETNTKLQDGGSDTISSSRKGASEDIVRRKSVQRQGAIKISDEILGFGGHGTIVYKGELDGRHVAVKRMLKAYHASAEREISLLIESDGHPHVVRYFLKEARGDFVYLALELCEMTLEDLIAALKQKTRGISQAGRSNSVLHIPCMRRPMKEALFEVAQGVKHIHSLRIVHRDLKPQNILLAKKKRGTNISNKNTSNDSVYRAFQDGKYSPKISDMGLGKQLVGQSSFGLSTFNASFGIEDSGLEGSMVRAGPGPGTIGWQAREVMVHRPLLELSAASSNDNDDDELISMIEASPIESSLSDRTSRSVDIFSLGCIFHYSLLPGSHPFGEWYERESNIMKNCPSSKAMEDLPADASDLIRRMIDRKPSARPNASQVCSHPFFWTETKRLTFMCDLSDRLEHDTLSANEAKCQDSSLLDALIFEQQAVNIVGTAWGTRLDQDFFNIVTKFRMYDQSCIRDLLRLIRNKHHHFDDIPLKVKEKVVSNQEDLLSYFESKFPRLFMHCYNVCCLCLGKDDPLILKHDIQSKKQSQNGKISRGKDNIISQPFEKQRELKKPISCSPFKNISTKGLPESPELRHDNSCSSEGGKKVLSSCRVQDLTPINPAEHRNEVRIPPHDNGEGKELLTKQYVGQSSVIAWEGSNTCSTLGCRGWMRSEDEWIERTDSKWKKVDANLIRGTQDEIFRTRLCNHWDMSQGASCPVRKKNRCVFAHGPVELRVKEGKRGRWGKLVDIDGNNKNPFHSGGEDTYGAAKCIETVRKVEGKWKSPKKGKQRGKGPNLVGRKKQNLNKQ